MSSDGDAHPHPGAQGDLIAVEQQCPPAAEEPLTACKRCVALGRVVVVRPTFRSALSTFEAVVHLWLARHFEMGERW